MPDDIVSVLSSFKADTSYPSNLNCVLQNHEALALAEYLSNYLRFANDVSKITDVIKELPIFFEIDKTTPISLNGNKNWYLLQNEESSYGKIIYPSDKGKFLSTSTQHLRYVLEDILEIPRLDSYNYWRHYVIPFLEVQQQEDIDILIDKLFDKSRSLLDDLKGFLGNISFVPVDTLGMSQRQEIPTSIKLVKPTELFDPEENAITNLFFEEEQVYPVGKYGIPKSSRKFFSILKLLGMKSFLSSNDIISRINTIITRERISNIDENRTKALNLFKYVDERWDQLSDNSYAFLEAIFGKEWVPTIDKSRYPIFSKLQDCYCQKDKYLVCLVAPVLEYDVSNYEFLIHLKRPDFTIVLKQLEFCRDAVAKNQPPNELKDICNAVYEYMNKIRQTDRKTFNLIKKELENKPWILFNNKFYSSEKVFTRVSSELEGIGFELPLKDVNKFETLYRAMGVRDNIDKIEIKDLIFIIKNMVEGNEKRNLSTKELYKVIKILKQISRSSCNLGHC